MNKTKAQDEKKEDVRKQQGGHEDKGRDQRSRQQQQDSDGPRQPGRGPDVLEENPELDVETGRSKPRRPMVEDKSR